MKKINSTAFSGSGILMLAGSAIMFAAGCKKAEIKSDDTAAITQEEQVQMKNGVSGKKVGHFGQVNLVANTTGYNAAHIDPTLVNAWGIAFSGGGTAWVSSQAGHVSDVYN